LFGPVDQSPDKWAPPALLPIPTSAQIQKVDVEGKCHATTEDVAQCCHQLQGNAFGALMNDTVDLRTGELYSALGDSSVEHGEAYLT